MVGKSKGAKKIARVMREYKEGTLKSSSGQVVENHKQAVAIAISEANKLPGKQQTERSKSAAPRSGTASRGRGSSSRGKGR